MIKTAYRKNDSGFFRPIKRLFLTTATIATIMYIGAKVDFDLTVDRLINGEKEVAANYSAVGLERKINPEGKAEFYIQYEKNGVKTELPVLTGTNGPQLGTIEYALQNIDYSKLTREQAFDYARQALKEGRFEFLLSDFAEISKNQAYELTKNAWEKLDSGQRYAIVKTELEKLLR